MSVTKIQSISIINDINWNVNLSNNYSTSSWDYNLLFAPNFENEPKNSEKISDENKDDRNEEQYEFMLRTIDELLKEDEEEELPEINLEQEDTHQKRKNPRKILCKFFLSGQCKAGGACKFSHDVTCINFEPPKRKDLFEEDKICRYYAQGFCRNGDDCPFIHAVGNSTFEENAVPERNSKICPFFIKGECKHGNKCKFQHIRFSKKTSIPCKYFNSGNGICPFGDKCKYLH